jgi:hypothetical protein
MILHIAGREGEGEGEGEGENGEDSQRRNEENGDGTKKCPCSSTRESVRNFVCGAVA